MAFLPAGVDSGASTSPPRSETLRRRPLRKTDVLSPEEAETLLESPTHITENGDDGADSTSTTPLVEDSPYPSPCKGPLLSSQPSCPPRIAPPPVAGASQPPVKKSAGAVSPTPSPQESSKGLDKKPTAAVLQSESNGGAQSPEVHDNFVNSMGGAAIDDARIAFIDDPAPHSGGQ